MTSIVFLSCRYDCDCIQVASHVQKYFIKLAKAGLPVPGRMPNVAAYTSKSKKVYTCLIQWMIAHTCIQVHSLHSFLVAGWSFEEAEPSLHFLFHTAPTSVYVGRGGGRPRPPAATAPHHWMRGRGRGRGRGERGRKRKKKSQVILYVLQFC